MKRIKNERKDKSTVSKKVFKELQQWREMFVRTMRRQGEINLLILAHLLCSCPFSCFTALHLLGPWHTLHLRCDSCVYRTINSRSATCEADLWHCKVAHQSQRYCTKYVEHLYGSFVWCHNLNVLAHEQHVKGNADNQLIGMISIGAALVLMLKMGC